MHSEILIYDKMTVIIKFVIFFHLNMSVDEPIQFKIIIIFAKGIDKNFSNLEPPKVHTELQKRNHIYKLTVINSI